MKYLLTIAFILTLKTAFAQTVIHQSAFSVAVYGKGKAVVFLPGFTCSGEVWSDLVAHYKSNYACYVFTLAGFAGVEPLTGPPYLKRYKDALASYLSTYHLEHVTLVGHSLGGFLAIWLASELKDRLEKVIIVDAMPFYAGFFNPDAPPILR